MSNKELIDFISGFFVVDGLSDKSFLECGHSNRSSRGARDEGRSRRSDSVGNGECEFTRSGLNRVGGDNDHEPVGRECHAVGTVLGVAREQLQVTLSRFTHVQEHDVTLSKNPTKFF